MLKTFPYLPSHPSLLPASPGAPSVQAGFTSPWDCPLEVNSSPLRTVQDPTEVLLQRPLECICHADCCLILSFSFYNCGKNSECGMEPINQYLGVRH